MKSNIDYCLCKPQKRLQKAQQGHQGTGIIFNSLLGSRPGRRFLLFTNGGLSSGREQLKQYAVLGEKIP